MGLTPFHLEKCRLDPQGDIVSVTGQHFTQESPYIFQVHQLV